MAVLHKKLKVNNEISSDQVTLVARYLAARDEFWGGIEILNGHLSCTAAGRSQLRDLDILKSWEFGGGADRYDFKKRAAEFTELIQLFEAEAQTVVSDFREQGWTVELSSKDNVGEVYHLKR